MVLVDLPGHGASPPIETGALPVLADLLHQLLRQVLAGRRVLLVGESVGATLALAIAGKPGPGPVRAVFAADPPLTTAKQWSVRRSFRDHYMRHPQHAYAVVLGRDFFGITPDGVEERIYYPVLGDLKVPAVIAAGDVPLAPPRWHLAGASRPPSGTMRTAASWRAPIPARPSSYAWPTAAISC